MNLEFDNIVSNYQLLLIIITYLPQRLDHLINYVTVNNPCALNKMLTWYMNYCVGLLKNISQLLINSSADMQIKMTEISVGVAGYHNGNADKCMELLVQKTNFSPKNRMYTLPRFTLLIGIQKLLLTVLFGFFFFFYRKKISINRVSNLLECWHETNFYTC